jgi:hypothetical protein
MQATKAVTSRQVVGTTPITLTAITTRPTAPIAESRNHSRSRAMTHFGLIRPMAYAAPPLARLGGCGVRVVGDEV